MTSETLWSIYSKKFPPPTAAMTELSFTKTFLSSLDSRPLKLQPDYCANPKTLTINGAYTLPKMPTAFKRSSGAMDEAEKAVKTSISLTLKSSRNPVLSLSLPDTDLGTTILDLKERISKELRIESTEKIRILHKKKPCGDVKTLKEVIGEEEIGAELEMGVMVMGYKEDTTGKAEDVIMKDAEAEGSVAQGPGGEEVLGNGEFWADLKGFLMQRLRDENLAGEVFNKFERSWKTGK